MTKTFATQRLVEFADTDMAGIMHFASFFHYMESVEHEFIRSLGLSVYTEVNGQTVSFPRVAAKCDFLSPAKCEDMLDAELTVLKVGRTSVSYRIDFAREGKPVATGEVTCVCCRIFADKPPEALELPEEIRSLLTPFVSGSPAQ